MTAEEQKDSLGRTLWNIADDLRGKMNADDFRDYMLSFLFMRYLSNHYEETAKSELEEEYPKAVEGKTPLAVWYEANGDDVAEFEDMMRSKVHYILEPNYLWNNIYELARTQSLDLLKTLEGAFKFIEERSFQNTFQGLFGEINLNSEKLGKTYAERNELLCKIISRVEEELKPFSNEVDVLGDAYEYLIGQFAAGSGKKAGEFYTPQPVSTILSRIVLLDCQDPSKGKRESLSNVLDFACGSGSLLLNVRRHMGEKNIGKIYGQENNITTYNLARMNMLLHGVKDTEFEIYHGDTLKNEWEMLNVMDPTKKVTFDAVVANPPFSLKWEPKEETMQDFRYKDYGVAPKSAADFAFLLHGFHYLSESGTMAIILPHGVLFRGGAEEKIRTKLLHDDNIDCVIGLPAGLFYSTGIPVCIIVLKKCRKDGDVLFINAAEHFEKGKKQNVLREEDIDKIVETYQYRKEEDRYSRRVSLTEIKENDYNLNITRYVSLAVEEEPVDLKAVNARLKEIETRSADARRRHNEFLRELGLEEI